MGWFLDPTLQRISDLDYLGNFNTQFWVLHSVYEEAIYNIHDAAKSMKSHSMSSRIYKKI